MGSDNSPFFYVRTGNAGVTAVVPESLDGCQCFTMLITSLSKLGLSAFYCYALNSLPSQRYFSLEGWGTAQVNISVPILKALPVAIPPLIEQHAIVEYLDGTTAKLDDLVAEAESAMRLLGDPSRFRALQRWAAGAMICLGGCAVMLDWLLWRTAFPNAPTWAHWAVPGGGIVMFVAGERLYSHALRRLSPPSTD